MARKPRKYSKGSASTQIVEYSTNSSYDVSSFMRRVGQSDKTDTPGWLAIAAVRNVFDFRAEGEAQEAFDSIVFPKYNVKLRQVTRFSPDFTNVNLADYCNAIVRLKSRYCQLMAMIESESANSQLNSFRSTVIIGEARDAIDYAGRVLKEYPTVGKISDFAKDIGALSYNSDALDGAVRFVGITSASGTNWSSISTPGGLRNVVLNDINTILAAQFNDLVAALAKLDMPSIGTEYNAIRYDKHIKQLLLNQGDDGTIKSPSAVDDSGKVSYFYEDEVDVLEAGLFSIYNVDQSRWEGPLQPQFDPIYWGGTAWNLASNSTFAQSVGVCYTGQASYTPRSANHLLVSIDDVAGNLRKLYSDIF